ncbi:hypothetical protein EDB82DRAFT_568144 [Fusarium venenatum]|uniref:uncharacterized protein n=1 Tax=Fusarium venenatum TaxID=56646 RepID=UPI001D4C02A7|nr:hypothetical protein EDB82DRAFT_568144 [Fusarium venenatum]
MDPLSIIASIAGIATAGAQLSSTLFHSAAIEMSNLSVTLEHLHDILKTGKSYAKSSFFDAVRHVVKNIEATQQEIFKMVADNAISVRLKWLKARKYLSEIDKQKVTLTLQITILSAAILVKSETKSSSVQEKVDNRFRIQAESLIQTGQASLQRDSMQQRQIPRPPPERAPSPPVRTAKRLPSPVRQSSIPGHVRPEELYGQSSTTGDNFDVPKQDEETNSAMVRRERTRESACPPIHTYATFEGDTQEYDGEDWEYQDRRGRREGYDPLAGRVAQFGQHFHLQGDAATFLYKLVFMTEMVNYGTTPKAPSSSGVTRGSLHVESYYSDNDYSDTENFDTGEDYMPYGDESKVPSRYVYRRPEEPARVVNQLLLAWTSLSQSEIEKGVKDAQPTATQSSAPKHAYVESDDESEDEHVKGSQGRSNWPHQEEDSGPHYVIHEGRREETPRANSPRHVKIRPLGQTNRHHFQPETTAPYDPRMAPFNYQQPNQQLYDPWGYPYEAPNWEPATTPPHPPIETVNTQQETPPKESPKPKFRKPHVVVLPQADAADSEIGTMTPKLYVSRCLKISIVKQGDDAIWNSDNYNSKNSIPGKSIMGALIGDKTARSPYGLDLAHTLIQGQNMKLVYIRGNDLGETWFINEQPVFLQFLHCAYLPQFSPAKESDITAMKQEYVAVGEEWASVEALNQLGLPAKGREEGRVLLDPSTTWSMVKELAITTLQLRSMRQRRLYTSTFYNSTDTFQQKHCGAISEPSLVTGYPNGLHHLALRTEAVVDLEGDKPDIFKFLVKDEEKIEDVVKSQEEETKDTRPQIAITPPPSPREPSSPELDTSDMSSTSTSRSRFSRFVKRYTSGRKHDQLSPPLQRYGSKNSGNEPAIEELEDNEKRPATPADSGVGSSVN